MVLKPQNATPAIVAVIAERNTAIVAYVIAARVFAANTCPRSTERVRIVFSVPFPSSAAITSPATSAAISGSRKKDSNRSISSGVASPDCVIWAAKMLSCSCGWCGRNCWLNTKISGISMPSPSPR